MCSSGPSRYSPQRRDSRIPREGLSNRCSVCRSLHKLFRSNDENFDRISTCLEVVIPQTSRRSIISCQTLTEIRARGQYKAEVAGRGGRRGRCEGRWVSVRKNAIEVMGQPKGYVLLKTLEASFARGHEYPQSPPINHVASRADSASDVMYTSSLAGAVLAGNNVCIIPMVHDHVRSHFFANS